MVNEDDDLNLDDLEAEMEEQPAEARKMPTVEEVPDTQQGKELFNKLEQIQVRIATYEKRLAKLHELQNRAWNRLEALLERGKKGEATVASPEAERKEVVMPRKRGRRSDGPTNRDLILQALSGKEEMTLADVREFVSNKKGTPVTASLGVEISKMKKEGLVRRGEQHASYQITPQGSRVQASSSN